MRNSIKPGAGTFVITGPLFEGKSLQQLNDRVLVPTSVWKAVYSPDQRFIGGYVATNEKDATTKSYEALSIAALEQRVGINLFPQMPRNLKEAQPNLPAPEIHGHAKTSKKAKRGKPAWIVQ